MLDIATLTNQGDREINEDSVGFYQKGSRTLCVLSDGLGGHGKGDFASQLCLKNAGDIFLESKLYGKELIENIFESTQANLLKQQKLQGSYSQIKSTFVVCIIDGNKISFGHIGDSRLYLFRNKKVNYQTLDHSVPQMLVASGEIKASQIRHHEDRSRLLRAMGCAEEQFRYEIDCTNIDFKPGDTILLCSDGFWEWIKEQKMCHYIFSSDNAQTILDKMEKYILKKGKGKNMDNYSVLLAKCF